jgi:TetR/AcrR family transcriptional regulator, transcriptional repressor for nem operon
MSKNGEATKTRILDAAHALIMGHSLAGTSIDMVLAKAEITKGAFFYHLKSKAALARALLERYVAQDTAHFEENLQRAEKLSRDPLQQISIFIGLFQAEVAQFSELSAGCLLASYTYQLEELDADIQAILTQAMLHWRSRLGAKFAETMAKYPPRIPVKAEDLADSMVATMEGAFVMMHVLREPTQLSLQLSHFRNYVELLFLSEQ